MKILLRLWILFGTVGTYSTELKAQNDTAFMISELKSKTTNLNYYRYVNSNLRGNSIKLMPLARLVGGKQVQFFGEDSSNVVHFLNGNYLFYNGSDQLSCNYQKVLHVDSAFGVEPLDSSSIVLCYNIDDCDLDASWCVKRVSGKYLVFEQVITSKLNRKLKERQRKRPKIVGRMIYKEIE